MSSREDVFRSDERPATSRNPLARSSNEPSKPRILIAGVVDNFATYNPTSLFEIVEDLRSLPPILALAYLFFPIDWFGTFALRPPFVFVFGTIWDPNIKETMFRRGGGCGDGDHHFIFFMQFFNNGFNFKCRHST